MFAIKGRIDMTTLSQCISIVLSLKLKASWSTCQQFIHGKNQTKLIGYPQIYSFDISGMSSEKNAPKRVRWNASSIA